MVLKKGLPGLRPSSPLLAMYLATVDCATWIPSLSGSPWMRGAPYSRLATLISRISRRISNGTFGRLTRERDFQRQPEARSMPSDDGLRLDNRHSIQHRRKQAIEPDEEQSVRHRQSRLSRARADAADSIDAHQRMSAVVTKICSAGNVADQVFHNIEGHIETDVQTRCDQEKSDK